MLIKEKTDGTKIGVIKSPFGFASRLTQTMAVPAVVDMYRRKCGVDITGCFHGHSHIELYTCQETGLKFWQPETVAGDEIFYQTLSGAWPNYYRAERWEYAAARRAVRDRSNVLEIGCGRGFFLRSIEGGARRAVGIEMNSEAIANKVTDFPVHPISIKMLGRQSPEQFDAVCMFQVLEHIASVGSFLRAACDCLAPAGLLIVSTPNNDYEPHRLQEDAFDLPPHHMNHFSSSTYERISEVLGLDIIDMRLEPRSHQPAPITVKTGKKFGYKLARIVGGVAYTAAYRLYDEPGQNILVIMRKR